MPPAVTRPSDPAASPGALDPAQPAASLAETAHIPVAAAPRRRGPLRPRSLVTARARRAALMELKFLRLADVLTLIAAAILAAWWGLGRAVLQDTLGEIAPLAVASLVTGWALDQLGLYRSRKTETWGGRLGRFVLGLGGGLAAGVLTTRMVGAQPPNDRTVLVWAALATTGLGLLQVVATAEFRRWRASGRLTPNIVVVGATAHTERLIRRGLARRDVNILGVFDDRLARSPADLGGVPILGDVAALIGHRVLPHIDRVVVALDPAARARSRDIARQLSVLPNAVVLLVDLDSDSGCDLALARLADNGVLVGTDRYDDVRRAFAKRVQDLVLATVALIALSPLMAAIALAVKLDGPGPILFRQRRHGFNNEVIVVWKFRSMRPDADATTQVGPDDRRVTRVGRLLRRSSLDELPQLLNVLAGEMSLVGPRPHAVGMKTGEEDSARLVAQYAWRHRMKPGMTGWAVIHGSRGPLHTAEAVRRRVALDIEYVERQSFWLDLWILVSTLPCLLGDVGTVR